MKVLLLRDRFSHMGQHSGYDQLSEALIALGMHQYSSLWRKSAPPLPRLQKRLKYYFRRNIRATIFYDHSSFDLELAAAWEAYRKPIDLIHVLYLEDCLGGLPFLRQRLFPKTKLVATAHQPPSWWKINRIEPYWLNSLDALIVLDSVSKQFMSRYLDDNKIHVIPHGVDTDFFVPKSNLHVVNTERCLYVGQWLRDLEFFETLVNRLLQIRPNTHFDMIFKRQSSDIFDPHLVRLAQNPNVHFHPRLTDAQLLDCYHASSLLILPLLDSTANNAILEAMATGVPVVTTRVGGINDYLSAEYELSFSRDEKDSFLESVTRMLDHPKEREQMGKELREKTEREFDWAIIADRTVELYRKTQVAG